MQACEDLEQSFSRHFCHVSICSSGFLILRRSRTKEYVVRSYVVFLRENSERAPWIALVRLAALVLDQQQP